MRVFVTGGSGFTGSRVVERLVAAEHSVVAMGRTEASIGILERAGAQAVAADLDDPRSVRKAMEQAGAEVLVNVASLGFGHAPVIVEAAERAGIRRAIFVSTTAIFTSLPAPSKAVRVAAETVVDESTMETTIIRPTMIYGAPGDRNLERLVRLIQRTPVVPIPGRGNHLQQPVHVDDLAKTIAAAAETSGLPDAAYNVPGPTPLAFVEIIRETASAVGKDVRLLPIPLVPVRAALGLYARITTRPKLKVEQIDRLEEDKSFDSTTARRDLGHDPRPFAVGIGDEVSQLRAQR